MEKKFFETDSFAKTKKEWDAKLKTVGFEDIEATDNGIVRPQIFTTKKVQYDGGEVYYDFCQRLLRDFPFKQDRDRLIFELHAEGKSLRNIEALLKDNQDFRPVKLTQIQKIIHQIKEDFGRL